MTEEWRPVVGWERMYDVSSLGRVRSYKRRRSGLLLKPHVGSSGYPAVALSWGDERVTAPVHRLVAEALLGPRPSGLYVCHNDGDRLNPAAENLRYGTPIENAADREAHGTLRRGQQRRVCVRGHLVEGANLRVQPRKPRRPGGPATVLYACRACESIRNRQAYRARRDR